MRSPPSADYGAVVRRLTQLCQQVDALVAPVPVPASLQPQNDGRSPSPTPSAVADSTATIPRLVLVGGQSTGKTSLVECLAGVALPRSQGTCTRGHLDVTITASDAAAEWSATVHILLPAPDKTHPVFNQAHRVQFGDAIKQPDDVADRLRRATLAVRDLTSLTLPSPSAHGSETILNGTKYDLLSEDGLTEAEDSDDLPTFFRKGARLCLSIRAPGAEPLRFTDLPGLISEGHRKDVSAIRNMVLRDISDKNTIIVLTASFAMDMAHQNAFSLVKTADARGDRTIGVLTMPDRMPYGAERQWAKVINESLSGQHSGKHHLKHGWHVVRCPAQNESRNDIGRLENTFFRHDNQQTSPWHKTVALLSSGHDFIEECCGLQTLYLRLSRLLLNAIRATLPSIISRLQSAAAQQKAAYHAIAAMNPTTSYQSLGLVDRMKAHALIGQGSAGINMGKNTVSKYKQWVDEEMQAYLLLRTSLVARQRAADGIHKDFVSNATKVVTAAVRYGMVPADTTGSLEARATTEMAVEYDTADPASPPATPKKRRKAKSTAAAAASDDGASGKIPMLPQLILGRQGVHANPDDHHGDPAFDAAQRGAPPSFVPTGAKRSSINDTFTRRIARGASTNEYTSALGQRVQDTNAAVAEVQKLQVELDGLMATSPWPAPGSSKEATPTGRKKKHTMLELEAVAIEPPSPTLTAERLPQASLGVKVTPTKRPRAGAVAGAGASGWEQRRKPSSSGRTAGRDSDTDADASATPEGWTDIISLPSSSDVEG
ncbi:hypothetical protein L1887_56820 [Cichorium endivia]|nr:hypothetical protein L1887_56820 [Cichorium endivia]